MQAKNRDKDFQDHGWMEMEKLLDKEMPVRVLPWWKRFGILIPILILAGSLLGGSLWWFSSARFDSKEQTQNAKPTDQNATIAENEIQLQEALIPAEVPDDKESVPVIEHQKPYVSPEKANSQESKIHTEKPVLDNTHALMLDTDPVALETPNVIDESSESTNNNPDEWTSDVKREDLLTESLENNSIALLPVNPELNDPGHDFPDPIKSRLQIGLTAAANFGNLPGLSGGIAMQKQIGKSSFSWQTGLELGVQLRNFGGGALGFPVEDVIVDPDTTQEAVAFNQGSPDQIYYLSLETPLMIRYRFAPRWSVNVGGKLGYHLQGSSKFNSLVSNRTKFESADQSIYFTPASSAFDNNSGAFDVNNDIQRNRFYWATSIGFDYHATDRLSFTGVFQYGVRDEYPLQQESSNRLGAELRMSYFFNHPTK